MPFHSEQFYGDIKIGDFTLGHRQMDEILEPAPIRLIPKQQLVKVLEQTNTDMFEKLTKH